MRMRNLSILLLSLVLSACSSGQDASSEVPPPPPCNSTVFEGTPLTHCIAVPGRHSIGIVVGPEGGMAYRSLSQLVLALGDGADKVAFAMNAGMFDAEGQPIGYYVEKRERRVTLNRNEGYGNFHLLPNGVFFGEANGPWQVMTADAFAAEVTKRPWFGTQSGPMLVIDGKLHPAIDPDGTSLKLRNGVGVDRKGRAHFVISDAALSFGRLARFFRDELDCPDALFLDGSVSSLWDPAMGRVDGGPPLGPLIVVEKRGNAHAAKAAP